MIPELNERTNFTYKGPSADIGDLACELVRLGLVRSFWRPSIDELVKLQDGGVVELLIWGEPIPPVSLNALTVDEASQPYEED